MDFPQYRKYKNGNSYFEILSEEEFVEFQLQLGKVVKHEFKAKILPDRNYISDMLVNYHTHWDKIEQEELWQFLKKNEADKS